MTGESAANTISEVMRLRRRTRRDLQALWFPNIVFGILTLGGAAAFAAWGGRGIGLYWSAAGPAGGILTGAYYARRKRRLGLSRPSFPYVLTGLGIMAGCFLAGGLGGAIGSEIVSAVGPPLVVAAGWLVFARLDRSGTAAAVSTGLAAAVLILWGSDLTPDQLTPVLALVYGIVLIVAGVSYRVAEQPGK